MKGKRAQKAKMKGKEPPKGKNERKMDPQEAKMKGDRAPKRTK